MYIHRALLKHGYSAFSLEILEYCEPNEVLSREQYYLDLLSPKYNILTKAGSLIGFKHSAETIEKFKVRSPEQQEHLNRFNSRPENRERLLKYSLSRSKRIEVKDTLNNVSTFYPSMSEAARVIECDRGTLRYAIKNLKEKGISTLIKGRYKIIIKELEQLEQESKFLQKVELLDTLTNESTVYVSQSEAAPSYRMCFCNNMQSFAKSRQRS